MNPLQAIYFPPDQPPIEAFDVVQKKVYGNGSRRDEVNAHYLLCYLLVLHHNEPAARLCLYLNPAIGGGTTLLFGNLECINDTAVFERLMQEVTHYAKANFYTSITGPINGSTWDEYRLPITRFGTQFITDLPQPDYYRNLLLQSGFAISQQYFTYTSPIQPKTTNAAFIQRIQKDGITVRTIDLNHYEVELEKLYSLCNIAFANNVFYSPVSKADFLKKYSQVKSLLRADFVWIAEDKQGVIQTFIFCLPDPYQNDRLVMKTIARNIRNRQSAGLVSYLADIIYNHAHAAGFRHILHAFMHGSNRSKVLSEKYNGQVFKEYALFTKNLSV